MITSIEFADFKGQTATQPLTGMDIFVGRNGSGKTTRVQALSYAMLGYVPGNKKTPADTFKLATGAQMRVGLTTDTFAFARTLKKTSRSSAKTGMTTVSIKESLLLSPGAGERTDTEKALRIKSEMGDFPVMLDFDEFLSLSDVKRRDFIYSLSAIETSAWDRNRLHQYLVEQLLTDALQRNDPERYEAVQQQVTKAIAQYPVGYAISDGLQAMLDWVDTERRYWSTRQKDAQGAVRSISEQKNQLEETERGIHDSKVALEAKQSELIAAEKLLTQQSEQGKARAERQTRLVELKQQIAALEAAPAPDMAAYTAQLKELIAKVEPVPDIAAELKTLDEEREAKRGQIDALREARSELAGRASAMAEEVKSFREAVAAGCKNGGLCMAHKLLKCPRNFADPAFLDAAKARMEAGDKAVADCRAQVEQLVSEIRTLAVELDRITARRAELEGSVSKANAANTALNQEIAKVAAEKAAAEKQAAERESKLQLYRAECERLVAQQAEMPEDDGSAAAQALAAALREEITALKSKIASKEQARQALILVQQSMLDNREAEYNADALRLLADRLGPKGVQGELVKEIIEPIRADIAANLQRMGFDCAPFFQTESDTGKEIFQFGWINEHGHYVNFDALSAGQQTVFLAAMLLTIIRRKEPKTRILLMDNLNHLDRVNFQLLIDGLAKVQDELDNMILAGAIAFDFAPGAWRVWDLSAADAAGKAVEQSA